MPRFKDGLGFRVLGFRVSMKGTFLRLLSNMVTLYNPETGRFVGVGVVRGF